MRSEDKVNRSLRFSFFDGVFASSMTGFTQDYFTPFLLLLGATVKHIAVLSALPNLFASLMQLRTADLVEFVKSRKKIINLFVFLQALILLPIAVTAMTGSCKPAVFIAMVVMFTFFGAIATPAWGSLMSDLVKENKRGEYFGWRNKTLGFIAVFSTFCAGLILHYMRSVNIFHGFALIFMIAFISRLISWYFLRKMHEPLLEYREEHCFTIMEFLAGLKKSNFTRFVLFVSMMSFSVNLASPFFAVLMLKDLKFSYMTYTLITVTATLTIYIMMSRWGRQADKIGNLRVLKFVSPVIGILPLLWIINRNPLFLIFAQVVSGFAWAGFNLCASNFIYDAVSSPKRTRCIAYFNFLNGLALFAGAMTGGFLLQILPPLLGFKILTLLAISAFFRILVAIFMPLLLKEVRSVETVSNNELFFSVVGMRPLLGIDRRTIRY